MKCDDYLEQLSALVDDTLSNGERQELEKHLATCEACQETLAAFLEIKEQMTLTTSITLPKDFHETMMARLRQEVTNVPRVLSKDTSLKQPHIRLKRVIGYVSTVAAAALIVVWSGIGSRDSKDKGAVQEEVKVQQVQSEKAQSEEAQSEKIVEDSPRMLRSAPIDEVSNETQVKGVMPMSLEEGESEAVENIFETWTLQVEDPEKLSQWLLEMGSQKGYHLEIVTPSEEMILYFKSIEVKEDLKNTLEKDFALSFQVENASEVLEAKIKVMK